MNVLRSRWQPRRYQVDPCLGGERLPAAPYVLVPNLYTYWSILPRRELMIHPPCEKVGTFHRVLQHCYRLADTVEVWYSYEVPDMFWRFPPIDVRVQQQWYSYSYAYTTTVCSFSYLYHVYQVPSTKCAVIKRALLARPLFGIVCIVRGCRKGVMLLGGCRCPECVSWESYAVWYEFEYLPDSELIVDCRKMTNDL